VHELDRITLRYVESEDSVRLAGQKSGGAVVIVWLTRRLLDRLLPVLFKRLEKPCGDDPLASMRESARQRFRQQAAHVTLGLESPVPASAASEEWLASSADVRVVRGRLRLSLKNGTKRVDLTMDELTLRRCLGIFRNVYLRAGWSLTGWPEWARPEAPRSQDGASAVH